MRTSKSVTVKEIEAFPKWQGAIVDPAYIPKQFREQRERYLAELSTWIQSHSRGSWRPPFLDDVIRRERQRLADTLPKLDDQGTSPNPLEVDRDHPGRDAYRVAVNRWCADYLRVEAFWPDWVPAYATAAREHVRKLREQQEAA